TKRMWGAGALYYNDILDSGKSLYCPSIPKSDDVFAYAAYNETGPWPSPRPDGVSSEDGMGQKNVFSSYYYMPQSRTKKFMIPKGISYAKDIEVPIAAVKADDLDAKSVMSTDMMDADVVAHKTGTNNGVSALFADGHVVFSNKSEVFKHKIWFDGVTDINSELSAAALRAIIKGIEGKTHYMEDVIEQE
ncbi:hypothetical protein KAR91_56395, partial [Candidatus Pacearchaeota archaeon]|nr:hypothetical protein [Candidatus Pacearchaeota archaeon]